MEEQDKKISFEGYHIPGIKSGEYTIAPSVEFEYPSGGIPTTCFQGPVLKMLVAGPRFILPPPEIYAVFPPRDSLGEYDNVLPHIELSSSSLPWSRPTKSGEVKEDDPKDIPWLALLLLQEDEWTGDDAKVSIEKKPWTTYRDQLGLKKEVTDLSPEKGKDFPPVKIINIEVELLKKILPSVEDLKWLSHIRVGHDTEGKEIERAVLVSNRLPRAGSRAAVHLVSLEGRLKSDSKDFDYTKALKDGKVPLVSIHSWEFSCPGDDQFELNDKTLKKLKEKLGDDFNPEEKLEKNKLYRGKPAFVAAISNYTPEQQKQLLEICHIQTETFKGLMNALDLKWMHIPKPEEAEGEAAEFFNIGSVPLAHGLRQGGKTVSWYRGPCIADKNLSDSIGDKLLEKLPIRTADHLLIYNKQTNMLDTSYAAAWEIGRLLVVSNPGIAQKIARWKVAHARELAVAEQNLVFSHIPFTDDAEAQLESIEMAEALQNYFTGLSLLKGIPFHYLIPHESYLPDESLRFFYIDPLWVECLLDGAFSIGRTTQYDEVREKKKDNQSKFMLGKKSERPTMMGILLRSDLVSGWPSLMVDAKGVSSLSCLRFERLGPNVLLAIFKGEIEKLSIHLPPESLHFGFSRSWNEEGRYSKELKDLRTGKEIEDKSCDIYFKGEPDPSEEEPSEENADWAALRVVKILSCKKAIEVLTVSIEHSGHFAIELLEGVPKLEVEVNPS